MRLAAALILLGLLAAPAAAQADSDALPLDEGFEPVTVLSPLPDSAVSGDEPLEVSALLSGTSDMIIKLYLDSIDITAETEASGEYLFYLSPQPLPPGPHALAVSGLVQQDTVLAKVWNFTVLPAELAPEPEAMPWDISVDGVLPGTVVYAGYGSIIERKGWDGTSFTDDPAGAYRTSERGFFFKASYIHRF